jgi:multidrug resistance protein MdtO
MWLIFDQLWSAPAAIEMKRAFVSNLRWLAQLVKEPLPEREKTWRSDSLRETIKANFDKVASLADAVLFEFGPSRPQQLAQRDRIRRWQSQLRMLFVIRAPLLKYRLQLPGFELPEAVRAAQMEFDDQSAKVLEGMANRLEGKAPDGTGTCEDSFEQLEQTIRSCCAQGPQKVFAREIQTFLSLSSSFESVAMSLCKDF